MIERARPGLGTIAKVRAVFGCEAEALPGIDAAFAAMAEVERRMSFFDAESDLGRLHAAPAGMAVAMHPWTLEVIDLALEIAGSSGGLFDPARGGERVAAGLMPAPGNAAHGVEETLGARWRGIRREGDCVILERPLWLDLNGIAKGFAADRAVDALKSTGAAQGCVNIGGDLAVFGEKAEIVRFRADAPGPVPEAEVRDMAVAASGGAASAVRTRHSRKGGETFADPRDFAAVIAPSCAVADALTKIVLASGWLDDGLAARYEARAIRYSAETGWRIWEDV